MKNLCFFLGKLDFRNGITRVVYNIAMALSDLEQYQVSIMCTYLDKNNSYRDFGKIKIINLELKDYNSKKRFYSGIKKIRQSIKENNIDILVISGMEWCVPIYLAGKSEQVHFIAWEHLNFFAGPKFRMEWFGKRLACKKYDAIINITKRDKRYYQNYKGNGKCLYQIYNLTDFSIDRENYQAGSTKIVSCGYLSAIKGFDLLVEVAKGIMANHSEWIWDIYGEGKEREHLEKLISDNGLENQVYLRGYCPNMYELYNNYSIFVLTSRAEGMGMVLIEAQKAGLPVVSFDIDCGPSDVIVDQKNGFLVRPFDITEMQDKLTCLMDNVDLRRQFSGQSEVRHSELNKEFIIEKWKEMIQDVSEWHG